MRVGCSFPGFFVFKPPELPVGKGLWAGFAGPGREVKVGAGAGGAGGRGRAQRPSGAPPARPTSRGSGAAGSRAALHSASSSVVCTFLALVGTNSRQNVG